MKRSTRILIGLFALVTAAVLFMAGEFFLEGEDLVLNPGADPEAFGRIVTGGGFAVFAARGLVGVFLETLGFIALYLFLETNRVERTAFWGMITNVLGDFAGAAFFGTMLLVYPNVGPFVEANPELASALTLSPALLGMMAAPTLIGLILFAIAIWRCGALPKWSGVLLVLGFLILPVQIFVLQILGNALWGLGALWIFIHAWKTRDAWAQ